jgi:CshA-type fibril repeat protein
MPSWIQSWTWAGNGLTGQTGNLSDTISSLAPGASKTYTVVATVKASATGNSLTNTATVVAAADTNSANDLSSDTDAANMAPVANNDIRVALTPGSQSIQITSNDTDLANSLDTTTIDLNPLVAGEQKTLTVAGQGTWGVLNNGWVRFDPISGFTLDPTPITYTVKNTSSLESNTATVTLDYRPVATPDNSSNNTPGTAVTLSVLSNDTGGDTDFNLNTLTIFGTSTPGAPLVVPGQGTWSVSLVNGTITFTPEAGFSGDPSPIRYNIRDTDGNVSNYAVVTIDYVDLCVGFPLTLVIDDTSTTGYDIIVVDNAPVGTPTALGNTTHPDLNNLILGNLGFLGATAKFGYITVTALSKPYLTGTTAPDMSITSSFRSTGSGGTLNMYVTDGCFCIVPGSNYSLVTPFGGTTVGTVSFSETVDPLNSFLSTGTGNVSNSLGPFTKRSFSGTATKPFNFSTTDASLTKALNLKHGAGNNLSTSFRAGGKLAGDGLSFAGYNLQAYDDGAFTPVSKGHKLEFPLLDELLSLADPERTREQPAVLLQYKPTDSRSAQSTPSDTLKHKLVPESVSFDRVTAEEMPEAEEARTQEAFKPVGSLRSLLQPLLKRLRIRQELGKPSTASAEGAVDAVEIPQPNVVAPEPVLAPGTSNQGDRIDADAGAGANFDQTKLWEIVAEFSAALVEEQK